MKEIYLEYLACPKCQGDIKIIKANKVKELIIECELLECKGCKAQYKIVHHISRFVPIDNYSSSFGVEWTKHARTQYDSYSGMNLSEKRFFEETKWPKNMEGQRILEVGSGALMAADCGLTRKI